MGFGKQSARRRRGNGGALSLGWRVLSVAILLLGGLSLAGGWGRGVAPVAAAAPLTLTVAADDPLVGGTVVYTLTVKNEGNFPTTGNPTGRAYNVDIIDTLPPGVTYQSTSALAAPTIVVLNPGAAAVNQIQKLTFTNLTDIVVGQTVTFTITGKLDNGIPPQLAPPAGTAGITNTASAQGNANPRAAGDPTQGSGDKQITNSVLPFQLANKPVQSTGVSQATGGVTPGTDTCAAPGGGLINRQYAYSLVVTNNAVGTSSNLKVVDTLPYGVVYCPPATPGSLDPVPTYNADGTTTLTYTLPDQAANGTITLTSNVAVPYSYPPTQGTTTITNALAGQVLNDDLPLLTTATLTGTYAGNNYTAGPRENTINAKRTTIAKSGSLSTVVQGSRINYTLIVATSDYYDASNVVVTDTLPNGQSFVAGSGNPTPASVVPDNSTGTTLITWNIPSTSTTAGTNTTLTFSADVRNEYGSNSAPVVSADSFSNSAKVGYHATSTLDGAIQNDSDDTASVGQGTSLPTFSKTVIAVTRGDFSAAPSTDGKVVSEHEAQAAVGDIVTFQIDFATGTNLDAKDIVLTDILPPNYAYLPRTSIYSGSYVSGGGKINGVTPTSGTTNGTGAPAGATEPTCDAPCGGGAFLGYALSGIANQTPNIAPKNTTVRIVLQARVTGYLAATPDNLGKLSGNSSSLPSAPSVAYSLRDTVKLTTLAPSLTINKSNTPSSGVQGGQIISYAVTVTNRGSTTAYQIADLVDTFPTNIRYCDAADTPACANPTITPGGAATLVTPVSKAYNGTISFTGVGALAPGASFTITYQGFVRDNPAPVVGTTETNNASIASYSSQPTGVTPAQTQAASGRSSLTIGGDVLAKDATLVTPSVDTNAYANGTRVTIGDRVNYTLTYTLTAQTRIFAGEIRECLPYGFRYVANSLQAQVTSGAFPGPSALPTAATTTSRAGANPCPASQQELLIPIGDQDNTGRGVAVLSITLQAQVTGTDVGGNQVFTAANTTYFDKRADGGDNYNRAYFYRAVVSNGPATLLTTAQSENSGPANNKRNNRIYVPGVSIALALSAPTTPKWTGDGTTTVVPLGPPDSFVNYRLAATNQDGSRAFNVADLVDTLPAGLTPVAVYAGFAGDGSCNTAAAPLATATISGQTVSVPVNPAALIPNSLGAGETFAVCLRAKVVTTMPSLTLTDTLDLGTGVGPQYYSAPTGVDGRRGFGPLGQLAAPVRTQDLITFNKPTDRTYGDPPFTVSDTDLYSSSKNDPVPAGRRTVDLSVVSGPCVIEPAGSKTVRITGAGTCVLKGTQRGDNLAPDVIQSFVIAKAPLTVKVQDQTRQFGEITPIPCTLSPGSPSGFKYGDNVSSLDGSLTCATTTAASTTTGRFPLTPGGYTSANYTIRYVSANLTITTRPVTPTVTVTPTPVTSGQAVTITATIPSTPSGVAPRGSIQFWVNGSLLASVQVANGRAEYNYKPNLPAGKYKVEVRFLSTDTRFVSSGSVYSDLIVR